MLTALLIAFPALILGYGVFELIDDIEEIRDLEEDFQVVTDPDQIIQGTAGNDILEGTNGDDQINGADGDDVIQGGFGNDTVFGEDDDDLLQGQSGNDVLSGGAGDDLLEGGTGRDSITGGDGEDIVLGQEADDFIFGGDGNDLVLAGLGNDTLSGSGGRDWVEGEEGDDSVSGGFGFDTLIGGLGEDTLRGENGGDFMFGGTIAGTPLDTPQLTALRGGTTLADILAVGETENITLQDDGAADILAGGEGNDTLFLGAGDRGAGDEGRDIFAILADQAENPTQDFALIRDFTSDDDTIAVVVQDGTIPSITVTPDGDDALITIGETMLARVTGAATSLTAGDVTIIAAPTVASLDPEL